MCTGISTFAHDQTQCADQNALTAARLTRYDRKSLGQVKVQFLDQKVIGYVEAVEHSWGVVASWC